MGLSCEVVFDICAGTSSSTGRVAGSSGSQTHTAQWRRLAPATLSAVAFHALYVGWVKRYFD